jgi:NDP-sugar pyrophosphorylase family protein
MTHGNIRGDAAATRDDAEEQPGRRAGRRPRYRLQPYTTVLPKPLMPVGDRPVLDVVIRQLRHHGFKRVTIATGHLAELSEAFFGDGSRFGVEIDYFREDTPLGTAGALASIAGLEEDFLVMNGDILTDLDYGELLAAHRSSEAVATIAVGRTPFFGPSAVRAGWM